MTATPRLFKSLRTGLKPPIQDAAPYRPGVWTNHLPYAFAKPIALCRRGYHYCRGEQFGSWAMSGRIIAEVEICPKHEQKPEWSRHDKSVTCSLRIVRYWELTKEEYDGLLAFVDKGRSPACPNTMYRRVLKVVNGRKPDWEMEAEA